MSYPTFNELLPRLQKAASKWVPDSADGTPGFVCDDENSDALRAVLGWACAHPHFDGDTGKGLMLSGHKGTGKTLTLRSLACCFEGSTLHFSSVNTRKVTSAYNVEGDAGLQPYLAKKNMLFDDLGDERTGQHYGDKVEVMAVIIQERYELFIDHGVMSHFTTNLTGDEIRQRYGDKVYSRLKHMVNSILVGPAIEAKDRRETAAAKKREQPVEEEVTPASPEVAEAGFRRVREAIAQAAKEIVTKPNMHVVGTPILQSQDLAVFTDMLAGKTDEEMSVHREKLLLNNTPESSRPFVEAIDRELKKREEVASNEGISA